MNEERDNKETLDSWTKNPDNWKFGFFYFNPLDKRLMPPKKNPRLGYTINFANKKSVLLFILLISLPIGMLVILAILVKLTS